MRVHYTLLNLWRQPLRTIIGVMGVAFAALLVFVQLGFLWATRSAAVAVLDKLDYHLLMVGPDYVNIARPGTLSRSRLYQVLADKDVEHVTPLYVTVSPWRIVSPMQPALQASRMTRPRAPFWLRIFEPAQPLPGGHRSMLVIGFNVTDTPFRRLDEVANQQQALRESGTVLTDSCSRTQFFGDLEPGVETELGTTQVRVVGRFPLKTGFSADGLAIVSDETFAELTGGGSLDSTSVGLITLRPDAKPDVVADRLRRALPGSGLREPVRIHTRAEAERHEKAFWTGQTPLGLIFLAGTGVAVLIGVVFLYQVISSDMKNRLHEYATLKAIGYSDAYLSRNVLVQVLAYGVCGLSLSAAAAWLLFGRIESWLNLSMPLPVPLILVVSAVTLTMCAASGLLAVRWLKTVDPAELF